MTNLTKVAKDTKRIFFSTKIHFCWNFELINVFGFSSQVGRRRPVVIHLLWNEWMNGLHRFGISRNIHFGVSCWFFTDIKKAHASFVFNGKYRRHHFLKVKLVFFSKAVQELVTSAKFGGSCLSLTSFRMRRTTTASRSSSCIGLRPSCPCTARHGNKNLWSVLQHSWSLLR